MSWVDLIETGKVPPGTVQRVDIDGRPLAVVNVQGAFHVIEDTCTHEDYSLSEGEVWEDLCEIECPKHSSCFNLETGEPSCLPATRPVRVYPARVDADMVQADL